MGARLNFSEHDEKTRAPVRLEGALLVSSFAGAGSQEPMALQRLPTPSIPGASEKRSQPETRNEKAPRRQSRAVQTAVTRRWARAGGKWHRALAL